MAGQEEVSLTERLCSANSPRGVANWEQQEGYYLSACRASSKDIPELIEIARRWSNPEWFDQASDLNIDAVIDMEVDEEVLQLLPVTAWRTLADLKSGAAVQPLIDMVCELDDEFDDWTAEDLPQVFGKIGQGAIPPLIRLANDAGRPEFARSVAVRGLRSVVGRHPEAREQIVAHLTELMASAAENDVRFNTTVLVELVELQASEAAEAIEHAFAGDLLDVGMMGGWEEVRKELGVEGLRLEMPKNPCNSMGFLRGRMGVGIFSQQPLFSFGEINAEAEDAYYVRAEDLFSKSEEAHQIIERGEDLGWFRMLLQFGFQHLGQVVDELTVGSVEEFLFEHTPRKVSVEADRAAAIIFELTMFWEYVSRVFELPNARPIIDWLKQDGLVEQLRKELSDPGNFGMAKSIFMSGVAAGYDMTSEAGMAEYMHQYNRSLQSHSSPKPTTATISRGERIGRNELCPCGSGKKYKRCCRK